jgi:CheY-like chemotaxis protein
MNSGFGAIEKIKNGSSYDIIFMDHMMPELDGIEATKRLREMGYDRPIVALTANAVSGQAEIFLNNGFDDFLSKPIDVRQLNSVLNKLIRDKQPPEILEAAKEAAEIKQENPAGEQPPADPRFVEIFLRDANKSLDVLEAFVEKGGSYTEEDMRTYIIHTHGIKSALANMGKMGLSAVALKLEQLGRDKNYAVIASETPPFLNSLRVYINEITPQEQTDGIDAADEDGAYLREKLLEIKAACEDFDESAAESALEELKQKEWSQQTRDLFNSISEQLLHSDFLEIADMLNEFI